LSTYLYRLARWCFRHRRRVLAGWLLAVVVVVVLSVLGHGTENNSITIPGTESQQVVDLLQAKIPAFSGAQTQIVFVSPGSQSVTSQADAAAIKQAVAQMAKVPRSPRSRTRS
jgi:putative drug exporter of the RND superfamily